MLDTFIDLVEFVSETGTINEATMHEPAGLITIDGVAKDGKAFHLTYRYEKN